jgi:hypothetical protein
MHQLSFLVGHEVHDPIVQVGTRLYVFVFLGMLQWSIGAFLKMQKHKDI